MAYTTASHASMGVVGRPSVSGHFSVCVVMALRTPSTWTFRAPTLFRTRPKVCFISPATDPGSQLATGPTGTGLDSEADAHDVLLDRHTGTVSSLALFHKRLFRRP